MALPLTYREGAGPDWIRQRVREVLELVGMAHRTRHHPGAALGWPAAAHGSGKGAGGRSGDPAGRRAPGNLDSRNGESVMQLLEQLHQSGTTLCRVTHDAAFARRAQRIVHVLDGRIVDEDTFERMRHEQGMAMPLVAPRGGRVMRPGPPWSEVRQAWRGLLRKPACLALAG